MTTQQRIDEITEQLRDIYLTTNEGPRLIDEMVRREFPYPRKVISGPSYKTGGGDWGINATDMVRR